MPKCQFVPHWVVVLQVKCALISVLSSVYLLQSIVSYYSWRNKADIKVLAEYGTSINL